MRTRRPALGLVAVLVGATLSVASPVAAASFPPSEWVIGPNRGNVIITLDGGTTNKAFDKVLATLALKRAKASFFLPGRWVEYHEKRARAARMAGHALGNRGYGTAAFTSLSDQQLRGSIDKARRVLADVGVRSKPFLRAPQGKRDLRVLRVAGSLGYRSVKWTVRPGKGTVRAVTRRAVRNARWGSIISLDIWRGSHRAALPKIIDGLRRRGLGLRTMERLKDVHPIRWDVTLRSGSSGPEVVNLQKTLRRNTYPAGPVNGSFGYATLQATYAFQKTKGLTRDGVMTPAEVTYLTANGRPRAPRQKPDAYVDIDISRQVLFEVRNGKVKHTLPISSGNEEYYTVDGQRYKAHTPRGDFVIERKIAGKRVSRLGTLWWPSYFVGGYAVHGSDSVPTYPASHGCVRIPRYLEKKFFYRNPVGMPLFVHN